MHRKSEARITKKSNHEKEKDMKETIKLEKRAAVRWTGITYFARVLGISRTHLSRVMHGERAPGRDLEKRMKKLGLVPGSAA
jgi:transcriptional regulator with XRE-family HTH domain